MLSELKMAEKIMTMYSTSIWDPEFGVHLSPNVILRKYEFIKHKSTAQMWITVRALAASSSQQPCFTVHPSWV